MAVSLAGTEVLVELFIVALVARGTRRSARHLLSLSYTPTGSLVHFHDPVPFHPLISNDGFAWQGRDPARDPLDVVDRAWQLLTFQLVQEPGAVVFQQDALEIVDSARQQIGPDLPGRLSLTPMMSVAPPPQDTPSMDLLDRQAHTAPAAQSSAAEGRIILQPDRQELSVVEPIRRPEPAIRPGPDAPPPMQPQAPPAVRPYQPDSHAAARPGTTESPAPQGRSFRSKGVRHYQPLDRELPFAFIKQMIGARYESRVKVVIHEGAYQIILRHAAQDLGNERFGILVGGVYHDSDAEQLWVEISGMLPAGRVDASRAHVEVSAEEMIRLNDEVDRVLATTDNKVRKLGWYHTHPGHGIFMSGTDRTNQSQFYPADWHVALVVDPIRREQGVFTGCDCHPTDFSRVADSVARKHNSLVLGLNWGALESRSNAGVERELPPTQPGYAPPQSPAERRSNPGAPQPGTGASRPEEPARPQDEPHLEPSILEVIIAWWQRNFLLLMISLSCLVLGSGIGGIWLLRARSFQAPPTTGEPTPSLLSTVQTQPPKPPVDTTTVPTTITTDELIPGSRPASVHQVQAGETLSAIAAQYRVTVEQLVKANQGLDPNAIQPGQQLRIPSP